MVVRSKGSRSKTRHKLAKTARTRGAPPVTHSLRSYEPGSRVAVVVNGSVHAGMPHHRFHGLTGTVIKKQGGSFVLQVRMGGKMKTVVARPEHLRLIPEAASKA